tara:strand:+ start:37 stop:471 length:435 start_codon:yes stop_codon:yes gene_type:complete
MVEIISDVFVPWWILLYLLFVLILSGFSLVEPLQEDYVAAISSIFSIVCIFVFTIGFYHKPLADFFGFFVIPMTIVGISWEFGQSVRGTEKAEKLLEEEKELSDEERGFLINAGIFLNAAIVVPGYVMGLMLCFDFLKGLTGGG